MKFLLELFGRGSISLMVLYSITEVFGERLIYNWWFLLGGVFVFIWFLIPVFEYKKDGGVKWNQHKEDIKMDKNAQDWIDEVTEELEKKYSVEEVKKVDLYTSIKEDKKTKW